MEKKEKSIFTLPASLKEKLKKESEKRDLNMSIIVQLALEKYLREEKNMQ